MALVELFSKPPSFHVKVTIQCSKRQMKCSKGPGNLCRGKIMKVKAKFCQNLVLNSNKPQKDQSVAKLGLSIIHAHESAKNL